MAGETGDASAGTVAIVGPLLRIGFPALLVGPGVSKYLTSGRSVQFFETVGVLVTVVPVLVVEILDLGGAMWRLFDRASRTAALTLVPVMIVAAIAAGSTTQHRRAHRSNRSPGDRHAVRWGLQHGTDDMKR